MGDISRLDKLASTGDKCYNINYNVLLVPCVIVVV